MPKLKTNKAAKKRYSYTATGKVKRTKANKRHIQLEKQAEQNLEEKCKMLMQIKHVKQESKKCYHMETKIEEQRKVN